MNTPSQEPNSSSTTPFQTLDNDLGEFGECVNSNKEDKISLKYISKIIIDLKAINKKLKTFHNNE